MPRWPEAPQQEHQFRRCLSINSAIDTGSTAQALIADARLTNEEILDAELVRARPALAYLKGKIGNDAMRELLAADLAEMTARVRGWVQASDGAWQTGSVELILPDPNAAAFRAWYAETMANHWEQQLRAGHPEHFINHPRPNAIEIVENVGETELPWHIFTAACRTTLLIPHHGTTSMPSTSAPKF